MRRRKMSAAPKHPSVAITMLDMPLVWVFFAIWAIYGFGPALIQWQDNDTR
ncbi:hypothetical protein [Sedimentitalea nanhaiensis]|uniref:hypothetical protein n=1 Tax=Sedimentitalea nanhaiensis TaxID=999627 RepID=UPI000404BBF9|nr:hypothetical protein [Sedimentitalea nanhaiensis]